MRTNSIAHELKIFENGPSGAGETVGAVVRGLCGVALAEEPGAPPRTGGRDRPVPAVSCRPPLH